MFLCFSNFVWPAMLFLHSFVFCLVTKNFAAASLKFLLLSIHQNYSGKIKTKQFFVMCFDECIYIICLLFSLRMTLTRTCNIVWKKEKKKATAKWKDQRANKVLECKNQTIQVPCEFWLHKMYNSLLLWWQHVRQSTEWFYLIFNKFFSEISEWMSFNANAEICVHESQRAFDMINDKLL